ncbi:MucR family transcriptional regulator [Sphingomonas sp. CFBP9019]|uniref:MucR family transcriptional regulator n=1 Tax=Sphingomonas sp. CFBP9019 TaxID=3096532 RepID=UPI002A6A11B2|nr:MucR family transcriptional regulator [Sphingomonas sp. CFBP9019]MDY1006847.1 MucR family transcriptional regulator [Sphingomonas sp. CFBP9019]
MTETINTVELAAELTAAWLANPNTRTAAEDVPAFLLSMHTAVTKLTTGAEMTGDTVEATTYEPAVTARKSLASPDHIVSMIDGKKYKTLRRHLTTHGMTPEQYRERFNLKADYPMVAATYSEARRAMAKSIGLGRKAGSKVEAAAEDAGKTSRKTGKAALDAAKRTLGSDD